MVSHILYVLYFRRSIPLWNILGVATYRLIVTEAPIAKLDAPTVMNNWNDDTPLLSLNT